MPIKAPPAAPEQQSSPHLPPGPAPLVFEKFQGIKTSTTRPGVPDECMSWCDTFFPLAPRNLRTMYGVGPMFWTPPAGTFITFFDFANISAVPYMIAFPSNGSVWAIATDTGMASQIAIPGTIQNPSVTTISVTQNGPITVLIATTQTNGYFFWNGSIFYYPGDLGGPPLGIGGSSIQIYQGRVWIANGPVITFSAPGSIDDFASASGGGQFTSADNFLRVGFTRLVQSSGFLYLLADSSINYISGVQTSGSPPTTAFTNQNADPEVGTSWASSVLTFGRNIIFANAFGVHVSYGAAVTKVSEDLDGIYNTVPNFGGAIPTSAKATIFGKKIYMLLLPIIDPITGQQTKKLLLWNTKIWWAASQDIDLLYIQSQEINSVLTAWGLSANGAGAYRLFQQPSAAITKTVQSKLFDTPIGYESKKATNRLWMLTQYYNFDSSSLDVSIDNETVAASQPLTLNPVEAIWTNALGNVVSWTNALGNVVSWLLSGNAITVLGPTAVAQNGVLLGFTVSTNSPDMAIISMKMAPEVVGYRG